MSIKKILPFIFIVSIVVIFFRQFFLQNLLPIPSDTIIGLYNPFRDFYAKEFPRGVPFKNFLITDPVRQQYPWRFESIVQEKSLQLPLWNPYNFAGTPLLANQQSSPFMPFNLLFFMLPFPYAWSLLILLQPLLAGIFMYIYLKNLKVGSLPALLGSISFAFSGFFIAWLEWGTIAMTAMWLPLLLLCIDKIFLGRNKRVWYPLYFVTLIASFLAGHLQTFFYMLLMTHAYLFLIWIQSKEKLSHVLWGVGLCIVAFAIASVQWFPLFQFILLSARDSDRIVVSGWFLPWQHLVAFFVPDFFGNPTTLNYWGVWNYAEFAGYIGIPALFFALYAFFTQSTKRVWFFSAVLIGSLLFALPTFLAYIPFDLHIPFISSSQPTRLMVLIDFSLSVLSAFGLHAFMKNSKKIVVPIIFFSLLFTTLWLLVLFHVRFMPTISLDNILVAKRNLLFPTILVGAVFALSIPCWFFQKNRKVFFGIICCLLLLSVFDSLHFADKFTPFTPKQYLFPTTKTIAFLQTHVGNSRIMTTDSQILPPNFSLMYHVQSVDGYDPLYIKTYGQFIAMSERGKPDISEPFGFNRIITPHNYSSRFMDLLGVKYVISLATLSSPKLKKVFEEGQTKVYENLQSLPRAFFVKNLITESSQQKIVNDMYSKSVSLRTIAITQVAISENGGESTFSIDRSDASIQYYTANNVTIQTHNPSDGFLVLTDVYYPTWHAYVDGKETKIYPTDLALRGIMIPAGKHSVEFRDQLF